MSSAFHFFWVWSQTFTQGFFAFLVAQRNWTKNLNHLSFFSPVHLLINYKDTKNEMSSLLVFNRVYRLEIQSSQSCWYFRPSFFFCPSNLLSVHLPHPSSLPKVKEQYIYRQCMLGGGGGGVLFWTQKKSGF